MSNTLIPKDFDLQSTLPLWKLEPSGIQISRQFIFKDFKQAFAFMSLCAQYAEELNHHPDWENSWNTVQVYLSTHSEKGLTMLDIQLAKAMDAFALKVSSNL